MLTQTSFSSQTCLTSCEQLINKPLKSLCINCDRETVENFNFLLCVFCYYICCFWNYSTRNSNLAGNKERLFIRLKTLRKANNNYWLYGWQYCLAGRIHIPFHNLNLTSAEINCWTCCFETRITNPAITQFLRAIGYLKLIKDHNKLCTVC